MPQTLLPVLPLPMLTALLCAVISGVVLRLDLGQRRATWVFAALFATFALQSLLVGLRFGYGIDQFRQVQAGLGLLTGPLVFLGFASLAIPGARFWRVAGSVAAGMAALALVGFAVPGAGAVLDLGITLSHLGFAVALIALWRRGPDALVAARLSVARDIHHWQIWGAGQLLALAVIDSAIAVSFALDQAGLATTIIAYASAVTLPFLLLVFVALPRHLTATRAGDAGPVGLRGGGAGC